MSSLEHAVAVAARVLADREVAAGQLTGIVSAGDTAATLIVEGTD